MIRFFPYCFGKSPVLGVPWAALAWGLVVSVLVAPVRGDGTGERELVAAPGVSSVLLPAAFGIRTDRLGHSWSIEANGSIGRIGSAMVNSGLELSVNGVKFESVFPMMTRDASEFVLTARPDAAPPGLVVQRRVKVEAAEGGVRYVESFYNSTSEPMVANVSLVTNFSGNYKTIVTDRGRTEPVLLHPLETGIMVLPDGSQSSRAYLFSLRGADSALVPAISSQNRYGITVQYRLDLAPGATVALCHKVSQVAIPKEFDRSTLTRIFHPYFLENVVRMSDEPWTGYVANVEKVVMDPQGGERAVALRLKEAEGGQDWLFPSAQAKLPGKVTGGLTLESVYGELALTAEDLLGVAGSSGRPAVRPRWFLQGGQILSGHARSDELLFAETGKAPLPLDWAQLDQLVLHREQDSALGETAGGGCWLMTRSGDRLLVKSAGGTLLLTTSWGPMEVPLESVQRLSLLAEFDAPGYWLILDNGTRCRVLFGGPELEVDTESFGKITIRADDVDSIYRENPGKKPSQGIDQEKDAVRLKLAGGQWVTGRMRTSEFSLLAGGHRMETEAGDIREFRRTAHVDAVTPGIETPSIHFEVERRNGGLLQGYLIQPLLQLEVGGRSWDIPVGDVWSAEWLEDGFDPELKPQLEALLALLGDDDWSKREQATRELGAYAHLAKAWFRDEAKRTGDPEVRRRLERILAKGTSGPD